MLQMGDDCNGSVRAQWLPKSEDPLPGLAVPVVKEIF